MGAFHISCTFLVILGKRFGDAGLHDILIKSHLVGLSAVDQILHLKHYNQALCCHTTVMEAMCKMNWVRFQEWLEWKQVPVDQDLIEALSRLRLDISYDTVSSLSTLSGFKKLMSLFNEFCAENDSPTVIFWSSYIYVVCLLLQFSKSSREGN